jgi:hypothetical protein
LRQCNASQFKKLALLQFLWHNIAQVSP